MKFTHGDTTSLFDAADSLGLASKSAVVEGLVARGETITPEMFSWLHADHFAENQRLADSLED